MQLENNTLYYIYDPMCSWCYAFEQSLSELKKDLPPQLVFKSILGGLAADNPAPMPLETQKMVQQAWQRIEKILPTIHFNFNFWEKNTPQRSTYPACRAILAAMQQGSTLADLMRTTIQKAYYQEAKNPSLQAVLIDCATEINLDTLLFKHDLNSPKIYNQLQEQIQFSQFLTVNSYPSLRLSLNNELYTLPINYTEAEPILRHIRLLVDKHHSTFIESPCQRNCCLNDQDICLGCFRTLSEITEWSYYSELEKQEILEHTAQRKKLTVNSPYSN